MQLSAGTVGGAPPSLMRQVTSVDGGAEDGSKPEGLGGGGDDDGAGDGGQMDMGLMMATIASLNTSSSSSVETRVRPELGQSQRAARRRTAPAAKTTIAPRAVSGVIDTVIVSGCAVEASTGSGGGGGGGDGAGGLVELGDERRRRELLADAVAALDAPRAALDDFRLARVELVELRLLRGAEEGAGAGLLALAAALFHQHGHDRLAGRELGP